LLFDPLAAKAIASGKYRSVGNLPEIYKEQTGEEFLWTGYATNDDMMRDHPEALEAFTLAWIEAVEYVKNHPEVMVPYGKQLGLDESGTDLLRQRLIADYVLDWDAQRIAYLQNFATASRKVMGSGFLDNVPEEAFTTRFAPAK